MTTRITCINRAQRVIYSESENSDDDLLVSSQEQIAKLRQQSKKIVSYSSIQQVQKIPIKKLENQTSDQSEDIKYCPQIAPHTVLNDSKLRMLKQPKTVHKTDDILLLSCHSNQTNFQLQTCTKTSKKIKQIPKYQFSKTQELEIQDTLATKTIKLSKQPPQPESEESELQIDKSVVLFKSKTLKTKSNPEEVPEEEDEVEVFTSSQLNKTIVPVQKPPETEPEPKQSENSDVVIQIAHTKKKPVVNQPVQPVIIEPNQNVSPPLDQTSPNQIQTNQILPTNPEPAPQVQSPPPQPLALESPQILEPQQNANQQQQQIPNQNIPNAQIPPNLEQQPLQNKQSTNQDSNLKPRHVKLEPKEETELQKLRPKVISAKRQKTEEENVEENARNLRKQWKK
ncbi:Hypothetical_protein [Hexamita inflata]|uniref:Hypothetical_protein n=1 Tax=Hexamita inflata TaxID=28002 RepID=A0AA86NSA0_9EUKA|nr:Hypothetical protein HINF_LOCUS12307 [Hexamita inflata]